MVDLGCGPGNSTELLAARFPNADLTGVDSSPEMLVVARRRLPVARFVEADIANWHPDAPVDLLFANAAMQWVPRHLDVMARLLSELPAGGVLAVQMPDNLDEPSHRAMREVAASGSWAEKLAPAISIRDSLPPAAVYYDRLRPLAGQVDIWHTVYNHALGSPEAIVDWVKGTGLRPFLDPLDDKERPAFLAEYGRRLRAAYPLRVDGTVLFRFPRIFIVAVRA